MSIDGPILLYGSGREAKSTRRFLAEFFPDTKVHLVVDSGEADVEDTKQVTVDSLIGAFAAKDYAMVVRSPGVSIYKPEIVAAKQAGIEVTTNVNLWARYKRGNTTAIAITGTKGKSTTAKLIHTILKAANMDAGLAGNIGVPVLDLENHDIVVLELSSFQCADLELNPDFIGITSLFPEHLDWHLNAQNYFADKLNILCRKKPYQCALSLQIKSMESIPQPPNDLVHALPKPDPQFETDLRQQTAKSKLKGNHNAENAIIAARICRGLNVSKEAILEGIKVFEPLPHRLQEFRFGGKLFVNDSIATNPEATKAAIATYTNDKVALIVGGFDRGQDYDGLIAFLKSSDLAEVWFLPDTGERISSAFDGKQTSFASHKATSLSDLFSQLANTPDQFDTLILSPGAPSYNQFKNFEQRGDVFVDLARKHFE